MNNPAPNFDELSQRVEKRKLAFASGLAVIAIAAVTITAVMSSHRNFSGNVPDAVSDVQSMLVA